MLKGMDKTLDTGSLRSMVLELAAGRGHRDDVLQLLADKGFRVHAIHQANYILVRDIG